ncbi:MAG: 5-formyltetrahydrofolate cyclo-ligase [Clostridia bacterium]
MNKRQEKKELRNIILAERDRLSKKYRKEASEKIIEKIMDLKCFKKARTVMTFVSFSSEVDTRTFIEKCWRLGKRVVTPLAVMKTKELLIYEINNWNQLQSGVYGILEPIPDENRLVKPAEIDLVINPGVAFDMNLNRLGYGGGFYDRFYHNLDKKCTRVAIAFDMQIIKEVPTDRFDIPVDMLITEKRILTKTKI